MLCDDPHSALPWHGAWAALVGGTEPPSWPYWADWALRPVGSDMRAWSIAAALGALSRQARVPCIVPVQDDTGDGPPTWLRQAASFETTPGHEPRSAVSAISYWARGNGHEGFTTPHYVVMVPCPQRLGPDSLPGASYGIRESALAIAIATAPADVALHLACGFKVIAQQLSEEAQATLVRSLIVNRSGHGYSRSLEKPLMLAVSLAPTLIWRPSHSDTEVPSWVSLAPALRQRSGAACVAAGAPRSLLFDEATDRLEVVEWGPDRHGRALGRPPMDIDDCLAAFRSDWVTVRQRLRALQRTPVDLGGRAKVGAVCAKITECPVNAGPFADAEIWATPARLPAGSAVQALALALRARIAPEAGGLRFERPDGYAVPEPVKRGLQWARSQMPDREDLWLACLALDGLPFEPFGGLDPPVQDTIRDCLANSENPPAITHDTMVRLGLELVYALEPVVLTRDDANVDGQDGRVRLRATPPPGATCAFNDGLCAGLLVDPFLIDVLP